MLAARRSYSGRVAALAVLALAVAGPTPAEEPPDLSGLWHLPEKAQEELKAQVEASVGPDKSRGGGSSKARFTLLGRGGSNTELQRMQLRSLLLGQVTGFEDLEIEQEPDEITLARGNDSLRSFSFSRERTRETELGDKTKTQASWKDRQLILKETGKDLSIVEAFTLLPGGSRLTHVVRLEAKPLEQPLELRLIYDRVADSEE
jgi:hypothetical protein